MHDQREGVEDVFAGHFDDIIFCFFIMILIFVSIISSTRTTDTTTRSRVCSLCVARLSFPGSRSSLLSGLGISTSLIAIASGCRATFFVLTFFIAVLFFSWSASSITIARLTSSRSSTHWYSFRCSCRSGFSKNLGKNGDQTKHK